MAEKKDSVVKNIRIKLVRPKRTLGGFGAGTEYRVVEFPESADIPHGAVQVSDSAALTDWKDGDGSDVPEKKG